MVMNKVKVNSDVELKDRLVAINRGNQGKLKVDVHSHLQLSL